MITMYFWSQYFSGVGALRPLWGAEIACFQELVLARNHIGQVGGVKIPGGGFWSICSRRCVTRSKVFEQHVSVSGS